MHKFIVDRRYWLRGHTELQHSYLRVPATGKLEGHMCCVGFMCLTAGLPAEILEGAHTVAEIATHTTIPESLQDMIINRTPTNSIVASEIYRTNDDVDLPDDEREKELKEQFERINWEVEFIN